MASSPGPQPGMTEQFRSPRLRSQKLICLSPEPSTIKLPNRGALAKDRDWPTFRGVQFCRGIDPECIVDSPADVSGANRSFGNERAVFIRCSQNVSTSHTCPGKYERTGAAPMIAARILV